MEQAMKFYRDSSNGTLYAYYLMMGLVIIFEIVWTVAVSLFVFCGLGGYVGGEKGMVAGFFGALVFYGYHLATKKGRKSYYRESWTRKASINLRRSMKIPG